MKYSVVESQRRAQCRRAFGAIMEEFLVCSRFGYKALQASAHHVVEHLEKTYHIAFSGAVGSEQYVYVAKAQCKRMLV